MSILLLFSRASFCPSVISVSAAALALGDDVHRVVKQLLQQSPLQLINRHSIDKDGENNREIVHALAKKPTTRSHKITWAHPADAVQVSCADGLRIEYNDGRF